MSMDDRGGKERGKGGEGRFDNGTLVLFSHFCTDDKDYDDRKIQSTYVIVV